MAGKYVKGGDVVTLLQWTMDFASADEFQFFKGTVYSCWRLGLISKGIHDQYLISFCQLKGIKNE